MFIAMGYGLDCRSLITARIKIFLFSTRSDQLNPIYFDVMNDGATPPLFHITS
jgi:hypothetical protein